MKKLLFSVLIMLLAACAFAQSGPIHIPGVTIRSITFSEDLQLYEVAGNGSIFYVTKDLKHALLGNLFSLPDMQNLTKKRIEQAFRIEFAKLDLSAAVQISVGTKKIAIFTDPGCPHCRRLHDEIAKLKDYSVYVFLTAFGDKSKAESIWCSGDRVKAVHTVYKGGSVGPRGCNADALKENLRFAREYGINALPTIVLDDGRRHVGYLKAEDIARMEEEGK